MIIYNPVNPTSEIIFNLNAIAYVHRKLVTPDASFILGEWVGLGAGKTAVKINSSSFVQPAMVYTETGRHDVAESEGVTVVRGYHHLSTMNYVLAQGFAIGDRIMVMSSDGIGKLAKLSTSSGTYYVVGEVMVPPAVDGIDRLIAEMYATPVVVDV